MVVIMIRKLAIGATLMCLLFVGTMYSASGLTITELANTVLGGNAKTWYLVLSTKAVAKVVRRVVIGVVITPP